jgi:putative oxidoreductase
MNQKFVDVAYTLLRVMVGLVFIQYGTVKMFGWFGGLPPGAELTPLLRTAASLELVGGSLIVLGLFVRPVAFVLAGEMAVAYFVQHFPHGATPLQNHGEPAYLLCFTYIFMAAYGGGPYSLDALLVAKGIGVKHVNAP